MQVRKPRQRNQTKKGTKTTGDEDEDDGKVTSIDPIDIGLFARDKLIVIESGLPETSLADKEVTIYCFIPVYIHW